MILSFHRNLYTDVRQNPLPQPAVVSIPGFSIKMFLNLDVDKINMNVNEIVGLPPPMSIVCLF